MYARSFLSIAIVVLVSTSLAAQDVPRFEPAECPVDGVAEGDDVDCGYLIVPESRDRAESRTLRLAVAIVRSPNKTPRPDPLVFLSGGPGGKSVEFVPFRLESSFWNQMREERDLVFYDQRGTGYSDPKFCPEMDLVLYQGRLRGLAADEKRELEREAALDCRRRMLAEGLDFAAYNSATSARDLDDLRGALGYESWNLFGVSYGTRLALSAMRDTAAGIRSVILDSVLPPDVPALVDGNWRLARSLRLVFDQCAAAADCRRAFPDLERDFYAMLDGLERDPIELAMWDTARFPDGRVVVDGTLIAVGVLQGLYDRDVIPFLPLLVREVSSRNTDVLAALADGLVEDPHNISSGLEWAVNCFEAGMSLAVLEADRAEHPELSVLHETADTFAICDAWNPVRAGAEEFQPVVSGIPALVAAGAFDPITPPDYSRRAAETLANSVLIEAPGVGHVVLPYHECTRALMVDFLDDPGNPLDLTCLEDLPTVGFITDVTIRPGIYRLLSIVQRGPGPLLIVILGLTLLSLLSVVIWPLVWLVRRVLRRPVATAGWWGACWLAGGASSACLGFLGGLVATVLQTLDANPFLLAFGLPGSASPLFLLPWIAMVLAATAVVVAVASWKAGWWTLMGRVHYSVVAAAGIAFVAFLASWGLV